MSLKVSRLAHFCLIYVVLVQTSTCLVRSDLLQPHVLNWANVRVLHWPPSPRATSPLELHGLDQDRPGRVQGGATIALRVDRLGHKTRPA